MQAALLGFGQCFCMAATTVLTIAHLSAGLALCPLNIACESEAGILSQGILNWLTHEFCAFVKGSPVEWGCVRGGVRWESSSVGFGSKDDKSTVCSFGTQLTSVSALPFSSLKRKNTLTDIYKCILFTVCTVYR